MPEGNSDASILIAISFQALNRVVKDNKETMVCDSTVVILFAAFFIEANLNHIKDMMNKKEGLLDITNRKKQLGSPGLKPKLTWFYNEFIELLPSNGKIISEKLELRFPGFGKIHQFRNDISHGRIDLSHANSKDAEEIRQQAKNIVNLLYDLVFEKTGLRIPRDMTYTNSISALK